MHRTDNPSRITKAERNLTLLESHADETHYIQVLRINPTSPEVRGLASTTGLTQLILTLPGNWGDHLCYLCDSIQRKNKFLLYDRRIFCNSPMLGDRSHLPWHSHFKEVPDEDISGS